MSLLLEVDTGNVLTMMMGFCVVCGVAFEQRIGYFCTDWFSKDGYL